MRADYVDTVPLIDLAQKLCEPLQHDTAGLNKHGQDIKEEFQDQLRLVHFHRTAFAHHTNQPAMALSSCTSYVHSLQEKLAGTEDHRLGVALNELGVSHLQSGSAAEAETCLRRSIAILEPIKDATANTRSMPMINLGFALWIQGRQDEAVRTFEDTLEDRESAYGLNDTKSFAYVNIKL